MGFLEQIRRPAQQADDILPLPDAAVRTRACSWSALTHGMGLRPPVGHGTIWTTCAHTRGEKEPLRVVGHEASAYALNRGKKKPEDVTLAGEYNRPKGPVN